MKTLFKTTIVLALTVFASATFATGIETYIKVRSNNTFSVHHNARGEFRFTLKNEAGSTLYTVKGKEEQAFVKTFNVKNLPSGNYQLEVEDANMINIYPLTIEANGLAIDKEHVEKVFKPSVKQVNKTLDISLLKLSAKPLEVSIYDSNNKLVHVASFNGNVVNKRFDLSQLKSGRYQIYLEVGSKTFKKNILL